MLMYYSKTDYYDVWSHNHVQWSQVKWIIVAQLISCHHNFINLISYEKDMDILYVLVCYRGKTFLLLVCEIVELVWC